MSVFKNIINFIRFNAIQAFTLALFLTLLKINLRSLNISIPFYAIILIFLCSWCFSKYYYKVIYKYVLGPFLLRLLNKVWFYNFYLTILFNIKLYSRLLYGYLISSFVIVLYYSYCTITGQMALFLVLLVPSLIVQLCIKYFTLIEQWGFNELCLNIYSSKGVFKINVENFIKSEKGQETIKKFIKDSYSLLELPQVNLYETYDKAVDKRKAEITCLYSDYLKLNFNSNEDIKAEWEIFLVKFRKINKSIKFYRSIRNREILERDFKEYMLIGILFMLLTINIINRI